MITYKHADSSYLALAEPADDRGLLHYLVLLPQTHSCPEYIRKIHELLGYKKSIGLANSVSREILVISQKLSLHY